MNFRFYSNAISRASRSFASGVFIVGLLLVGFGVFILAFPEVFALLAAVLFFIAGAGCGVAAVKLFFVARKLDKLNMDDSQGHRENVRIYTEEHRDL